MGVNKSEYQLVDVTGSVDVISSLTTAGECASLLQKAKIKLVCIIDDAGRLVGTVSDGDIRRSFSSGLTAESDIKEIMNPTPMYLNEDQDYTEVIHAFIEAEIKYIPKISKAGVLQNIFQIELRHEKQRIPNLAFIMAGGRGQRLMPLTKDKPKPLVEVAGKPVILHIIEKLSREGVWRFVISVNYLGEMIKIALGDGREFGVEIKYIEEEMPLGTAGSLGNLEPEKYPVIVTNADLICNFNLSNLLSQMEDRVDAVIAVRQFDYTLPYGEVHISNEQVIGVSEKPTMNFKVLSGVYALSPKSLSLVEKNVYLDMPELISELVRKNYLVKSVALDGNWIDVGSHADLNAARNMLREA